MLPLKRVTAHNNPAANGEAAVNAALRFAPPSAEAELPAGERIAGGKAPADMTVVELKALAKGIGLTGCSTMNKNELIAAIDVAQG